MPRNCRACGRFARQLHCNQKCYGIAQRGKSKYDRQSPSKKQYIQIRVDGQRECLHRHVYQTVLNKPIPAGFIVHHLNHNKRDNGPKNLKAIPNAEHSSQHWWMRFNPNEVNEFDEFGW